VLTFTFTDFLWKSVRPITQWRFEAVAGADPQFWGGHSRTVCCAPPLKGAL